MFSVCTSYIYDLLDKYPKITLWLLPGNHDMPNKRSTEATTLTAYSKHPQIRVVTEPCLEEIEGCPIALVPYNQDLTKVYDAAIQLNKEGAEFLMSHTDLVGGQACIEGYRMYDGIPVDRFDNFCGGLFGHYHMHQSIGDDTFQYVGAPTQTGIIDAYQLRGITELKVVNGVYETEFIPIDGPKFEIIDNKLVENKKQTGNFSTYYFVRCNSKEVEAYHEWYTQQGMQFKLLPQAEEKPTKYVIENTTSTNVLDHYMEMVPPSDLDKDTIRTTAQRYLG